MLHPAICQNRSLNWNQCKRLCFSFKSVVNQIQRKILCASLAMVNQALNCFQCISNIKWYQNWQVKLCRKGHIINVFLEYLSVQCKLLQREGCNKSQHRKREAEVELAFPLKRTTVFREPVSRVSLHVKTKSKATNNTPFPCTPTVKERWDKWALKHWASNF